MKIKPRVWQGLTVIASYYKHGYRKFIFTPRQWVQPQTTTII